MKKPGHNDPCPCGSGKKYKQCCLKAKQAEVACDRSEAVPRALQWLLTKYGPAAREALYEGFFGGIDDDEYERLQNQHRDSFEGIMINAMEWLLADSLINIEGWERLRTVGRLPLFGLSYTALILIPIVFYGLAFYNSKVELIRTWAEQVAG
jgi:hypothetical protein